MPRRSTTTSALFSVSNCTIAENVAPSSVFAITFAISDHMNHLSHVTPNPSTLYASPHATPTPCRTPSPPSPVYPFVRQLKLMRLCPPPAVTRKPRLKLSQQASAFRKAGVCFNPLTVKPKRKPFSALSTALQHADSKGFGRCCSVGLPGWPRGQKPRRPLTPPHAASAFPLAAHPGGHTFTQGSLRIATQLRCSGFGASGFFFRFQVPEPGDLFIFCPVDGAGRSCQRQGHGLIALMGLMGVGLGPFGGQTSRAQVMSGVIPGRCFGELTKLISESLPHSRTHMGILSVSALWDSGHAKEYQRIEHCSQQLRTVRNWAE